MQNPHTAEPVESLSPPQQLTTAVQLRSLDLSGTTATDCLLYWLALRCCARLQRLVLTGLGTVTELGVSAVLAAKRALLHNQSCPGHLQRGQQEGCAAAAPLAPEAEVLPLLELGLGNCPAATQTGAFHCLARPHLRAAQQRWEAAHGGAMQLHLPPADSRNSGTGNSGISASLRLSLLEDPPDASCPYCPGQAASLADYQRGWPPESAAELLATLGEGGLGRLQSLDVSATTQCGDLAEVVAASCRQGAWAALQHCEDLWLPPGGCGLLDCCMPGCA
ncbi:hypothetical protein ABPG77_006401 [Micractinium sp. CCAP 211/92]